MPAAPAGSPRPCPPPRSLLVLTLAALALAARNPRRRAELPRQAGRADRPVSTGRADRRRGAGRGAAPSAGSANPSSSRAGPARAGARRERGRRRGPRRLTPCSSARPAPLRWRPRFIPTSITTRKSRSPRSHPADAAAPVRRAARPSGPTLAEFIAFAKANPGKLNYDPASPSRPICVVLVQARSRPRPQLHPLQGLCAFGHRHDRRQNAVDHRRDDHAGAAHRDGRLRPLAIARGERWPDLPDVPTMIEGLPRRFARRLGRRGGARRHAEQRSSRNSTR